jgi:hypothetical protein
MNSEFNRAFNIVFGAAFADKFYSAYVEKGADLMRKVHSGEMTPEEAYEAARFKDGDMLDQALSEQKAEQKEVN